MTTSKQPVALVTGASRGAGAGIARALGSYGLRVYVTGRAEVGYALFRFPQRAVRVLVVENPIPQPAFRFLKYEKMRFLMQVSVSPLSPRPPFNVFVDFLHDNDIGNFSKTFFSY